MGVRFLGRRRRWGKARVDRLSPRTIKHVWTPEDRRQQLQTLESLCDRIADLFRANGDWGAAGLFRERAAMARRLLAEGHTQSDLNDLGTGFPHGADWLRLGHPAFNRRRSPWQDEVAGLHEEATTVALDIRSIATLTD